jgi:hypothetical protein
MAGKPADWVKVTLAATDDLSGVAYPGRREMVDGSLRRSVQAIRDAIPDLRVDWATVSAPAQLVEADAPREELRSLIDVAREVGVIVAPVADQDVALS